ncbi:MAG: holin-like protein [Paraglaciecola sp.]|jgi:holin-like protein
MQSTMLVIRYLLAFLVLVGCWQCGVWLSLLVPLPSALLGLLLLVSALLWLGQVPKALHRVAQFMVLHLLLLFIPATMGVVLYVEQLKAHLWTIIAAILVSTVLSLLITAGICQWQQRRLANAPGS